MGRYVCSIRIYIRLILVFLIFLCVSPCFSAADLVVSGLWFEDPYFHFEVKNIGDLESPEGHSAVLFINGEVMASHQVNETLLPNATASGVFDYMWSCSEPGDTIRVLVDYYNDVEEQDEENNDLEEYWYCDRTPPEITLGPEVSRITQTSALISWETNEDSDSMVKLGKESLVYPFEHSSSDFVQMHEILLSELDPGTQYFFVVESTDASNNTVTSDELTFETLPEALPDLIPLDVWRDGDRICFEIINAGMGTALSNHVATLFIDGDFASEIIIPEDLQPDETWHGCFDFMWECSDSTDVIRVVVDDNNDVNESDETNNLMERMWICEVEPLDFVTTPVVMSVNSDSATISWETNRPSYGMILAGKRASHYEIEEADFVYENQHTVLLNGLEPSTTYHFTAISSDTLNFMIESRPGYFITGAGTDATPPEIVMNQPGLFRGTVYLKANVSDDTGVNKVEFFLGDELLFTDYSPPYGFNLNTENLLNGNYVITGRVWDKAGKYTDKALPANVANLVDHSAPQITFFSPAEGATVSGKVDVKLSLYDDKGLISCRFYIDGDYRQFRPFDVSSPPNIAPVTFTWDTRTETKGNHTIGIAVYDNKGNVGYGTRVVNVDNTPPPPQYPWLEVKNHSVSRNGNVFTVNLTVKNAGNIGAEDISIIHIMDGFYPVGKTVSDVTYSTDYDPKNRFSKTYISTNTSLGAGNSRTFSFNVIPIMGYPLPYIPIIGKYIDLSWESSTGQSYHDFKQMPVSSTTGGETMGVAIKNALASCDYLIVTNPYRLFAHFASSYYSGPNNDTRAVNSLLSELARLAMYKDGCFGFTYQTNTWKDIQQNLLKKGGLWSSRLTSNWCDDGYLLLVGELEILPSGYTKHTATGYSDIHVDATDIFYANTSGHWVYPEINVGRLIGNRVDSLRRPVQLSLALHEGLSNHNFDRSNALAIAGKGSGVSEFESNVDNVTKLLQKNYTSVAKYKVREVEKSGQNMLTVFKNNVGNKDVIFYRDHCNEYEWSYVIHTSNYNPINFGVTKPFLFACCCSAGRYHRSHNGNYPLWGIAETFLEDETGCYIGSTEDSWRGANNTAAKKFYSYWPAGGYKTIGSAFTALKNYMSASRYWSTEFKYRVWTCEYNLYGDPKYGVTNTKGAGRRLPLDIPQSLVVDIPQYQVTEIEGEHHVSIPGGEIFFISGYPRVPYYITGLECPPGKRVQNVIMTERSDWSSTSGLQLPIAIDGLDAKDEERISQPPEGFWPQDPYQWKVYEKPSGGSSLMITMYPFMYNHSTTEAEFSGHYEFEIVSISTDVSITSLTLPLDVPFFPGDEIPFEMMIENTGEEKDVIVEANIETAGSGDVVDGLLLKTLVGLKGKASFSPVWHAHDAPTGLYAVVVTIKDTEGNVLDREVEYFELGIDGGEIAHFSAHPENFKPGDNIDIRLEFLNTGTEPLSGNLMVLMKDSEGTSVTAYNHSFENIEPGKIALLDETWNTTGSPKDDYTLTGYAIHSGGTTSPEVIRLTSHEKQGMVLY